MDPNNKNITIENRRDLNYFVEYTGNVVFGECVLKDKCDGTICRKTRDEMPDLSSISVTYGFT